MSVSINFDAKNHLKLYYESILLRPKRSKKIW